MNTDELEIDDAAFLAEMIAMTGNTKSTSILPEWMPQELARVDDIPSYTDPGMEALKALPEYKAELEWLIWSLYDDLEHVTIDDICRALGDICHNNDETDESRAQKHRLIAKLRRVESSYAVPMHAWDKEGF